MIKANYHTHTYRCHHGEGDIADYCKSAVENGLEILAFTDHTPLPDSWQNDIRMTIDELQEYCEKIEKARVDFPQLKIIKGLECEYRPEYMEFYKTVLLGEYGIEMLVGGVHFYPYEGQWHGLYGKDMDAAMLEAYTEHCIKTIECGLFDFFAHPDLFANKYMVWDENTIKASRRILECAAANDMPIEINGYGVVKGEIDTPEGRRWGYPTVRFWEIAAEYDVEVLVSSDAHYPNKVIGGMAECFEIARKYTLKFADMEKRIQSRK